jgi:tRNA G18 (ribose-2'-O)-methylase SpoU
MDCRLVVPSNGEAASRDQALPGHEFADAPPSAWVPPMTPVQIRDFGDPRLSDYQNLKDATLAARRGRFIVEGRVNLEVLLARSAHRPASILLSERAYGSMQTNLNALQPACPVYVADQPLLDRVVGFSIHRGVLAACARGRALDPIELARNLLDREPTPRIVVLERVINHDNVGGIFRNAMALGARAVVLCPETCDPLYRKSIRTSMGGALCVPFARASDWPGALGRLRELGYEIVALDPSESGIGSDALDPASLGPTALLLGSEGPGLSDAALSQADRRLRIEMEPGVDSLNVATATGIALHALRVGRIDGGMSR